MTLAQLHSLDAAAIWSSLTPGQQAELGALVLRMVAAGTVHCDDDPGITARDRSTSITIESDCLQRLGPMVERLAPQVAWFTPERDLAPAS